jgi:hypothetical protein
MRWRSPFILPLPLAVFTMADQLPKMTRRKRLMAMAK